MSLSVRDGIAWSGGEMNEDCSVEVLGGLSFYIDIRIKHGTPIGEVNLDAVDWAMCGSKTSKSGETQGTIQGTWNSVVSSRVPVGESISLDTGLMNFDGPICWERGSMFNPKTQKIETHVEKWIDEECPVGERVVFLQRADDRLAILGIVGSRSASVGRNEDGKLYFWRKGSTLNYTHGNLEGENLVEQVKNLAEDWQVGSKQICDSKKWIVMEFYRKYLIGHS